MTPAAALAFVRRHGIVLASARGRVPSLAEAIAGEPIRGSWWAHPRGRVIFRVLGQLAASPEVLVCRLVDGKVTYVHRRLWPALVRAAPRLPAKHLAALRERHTNEGHHVTDEQPFPEWVPADVRAAARALTEDEAAAALGAGLPATPARARSRRPSRR